MSEPDEETPETRMARLILALRSQGVTEPKVLKAIEATPRELFTPEYRSRTIMATATITSDTPSRAAT